MVGGERIVRNNNGQPGAVDEALDNPPLASDHRVRIRSTMQIDEHTARAQAPLREHAGHAVAARRCETRSHRRGHRVGLWGVERHLLSRCLAVQQRRHKPHTEVDNAHLEGHGASFALSDRQTVSVRIGTHPRASTYQDTPREWFVSHCECSSWLSGGNTSGGR